MAVLALTDLASTDAPIKMALCMGATCIAQAATCTDLGGAQHGGKASRDVALLD